MTQARSAAFAANAAAREVTGAAREAAHAAGQAAAVAHGAAHELGAAAYAIRAVRAAASADGRDEAGRGGTTGVSVATRATSRRDPGTRAGRPEAEERGVLVTIRGLTSRSGQSVRGHAHR
jgi:hypothetical protein